MDAAWMLFYRELEALLGPSHSIPPLSRTPRFKDYIKREAAKLAAYAIACMDQIFQSMGIA
jgi:hypothetical protein